MQAQAEARIPCWQNGRGVPQDVLPQPFQDRPYPVLSELFMRAEENRLTALAAYARHLSVFPTLLPQLVLQILKAILPTNCVLASLRQDARSALRSGRMQGSTQAKR